MSERALEGASLGQERCLPMTTTKKKMGRPTIYSQAVADRICELIMNSSRGLASLLADSDGMPGETTVYRWLSDNPEFREQYACAREAQADHILDECLQIADDSSGDVKVIERGDGSKEERCDHEFVARSRLKVETRLKVIEKLAPKKYGPKQQLEVNGAMTSLPCSLDDLIC